MTSEALYECCNCGHEFLINEAEICPPGREVKYLNPAGGEILGTVGALGLVCPLCDSPQIKND